MDDNFQKAAKKIRNRRMQTFCKLAEDNLLNAHLINETKRNMVSAMNLENELMMVAYKEQIDSLVSSYTKNVVELSNISIEMGLIEINFRDN